MTTETIPQDIATRFDWLEKGIAEGRVLRRQWKDGPKRPGNGYERACLLLMLSPEVGDAGDSVHACPTWLLPPWFARMVPWIDDVGSDEAWPGMVARFASVLRRACLTLTPLQWDRLEYKVRALAVREAMTHVTQDEWGVKAACEASAALCERKANGAQVSETEMHAAARNASDAARNAARNAASYAARAARYAASDAANAASYAASDASNASYAKAKCVDRITTAILDAIEASL